MKLNNRMRGAAAPDLPKPPSGDFIQQVGEEILAGYQLVENAWKKAEAILASSHVPENVQIKVGSGLIGPEENPIGDYANYLGYVKLKNQWRICFIEKSCVYEGTDLEDEETNCRPITESPVDVRLEMFDWFPKLYEEVIKVTRSYVPKIKDKVSKFEAALEFIDL